MTLKHSKHIKVRFSELDPMGVVWHGDYALYFEDAREAFGKEYGLGYMTFFDNGFTAPLVELSMQYKKIIKYETPLRVDIIYLPTESAKIVFDYEIHDDRDDSLIATAHSIQVFLDKNYELVWENPEFYLEWKKRWNVFED